MHESLVAAVAALNGEAVLARPLDLLSLQYPLLIIPADMLPEQSGLVNICAQSSQDPELSQRGYWQVNSLSLLNNP